MFLSRQYKELGFGETAGRSFNASLCFIGVKKVKITYERKLFLKFTEL